MEVAFPSEVRAELQDLVASGEFPDEGAAVVALVRVGLSYRYRRFPSPAQPRDPPSPSAPPGLPGDVNWIR
jgi:hypothetical protein